MSFAIFSILHFIAEVLVEAQVPVVAYTEKQLQEIELNKPHQSLYKVPDLRTRQAANVPRQQVRLSDVGLCPL